MKKDIFAICIVAFILVLVFSGVKIQSVDEYYLVHIDDITPESETVFLTIRCDTILDNWEKLEPELRYEKYVPADGIILDRHEYVLRNGDTVYDILDRAVRSNKLQMECTYSVNYASVYVEGINQLYEFSCGELSGWMYTVNGIFPNYGCSKYFPEDGDDIVWCYTCDLGRDVGCDWGMQK